MGLFFFLFLLEVGDAEDSAAAGVVGVAVKVLGDAAGACVTGGSVAADDDDGGALICF